MSKVVACHLACRPGFSSADAGSPWSMEARNIASEAVTPWYLPVRIASPSPPIPSLRIGASPISSLHLCTIINMDRRRCLTSLLVKLKHWTTAPVALRPSHAHEKPLTCPFLFCCPAQTSPGFGSADWRRI